MKKKLNKSLSLLLALIMIIATVPAFSLNSIAVSNSTANDLLNLMKTFENKFSSGTIYTNMEAAYNAYVAGQAAIDAACSQGDTSKLASSKTNMQNALNNMSTWTKYSTNQVDVGNKVFGDWDNASQSVYNDIYKNVLYTERGISDNSKAAVNGVNLPYPDSGYTFDVKFFIPECTLMYDGSTTPQVGSMFCVWGNKKPGTWNWNNVWIYSAYILSTSDISFESKWKAYDGRLNQTWVYVSPQGGTVNISGTGDSTSSYYNQGVREERFYASTLRVNSIPSNQVMAEYVPEFSARIGYNGSNGANSRLNTVGVSNRTVRVFNYKYVIDTMNNNYSKIKNVSEYKYGGLENIFKGYDLATKDPRAYFTSSNNTTDCKANYESAISAISSTPDKKTNPVVHKDSSYALVNNVESTCTVAGYNDYACMYCGATKRENLSLAPHIYEITVESVTASCTAPGKTAVETCKVCKNVIGGVIIPQLNHTQTAIAAVKATCQTVGWTSGVKCSVCNTVLVDPQETGLADHVFNNYISNNDATCAKNATETSACVYKINGCTETHTREIENSKLEEHTFDYNGEGDVTKLPTCTQYGETTYTCTICGVAKSTIANINPTNKHSYTVEVSAKIEPTCVQAGKEQVLKCATCDLTIGGETIEPTGNHSYTVVKAAKIPATCKADGKEAVMQCATCDLTIGGETIPKETVEHTYKVIVTDSTCTTEGYSSNVCQVCGNTVVIPDSTIGMKEHTYTVIAEGKVATCKTDGVTEKKQCTVCNEIIGGEVISKNTIEHTPETILGTSPTCQKEGKTDAVQCSVCLKLLVARETIPVSDHIYEAYTYNNDATCKDDGTQTAYCKFGCGQSHTITKENTKTDIHTFDYDGEGKTVKYPTCISMGQTEYTCTVCGNATDIREDIAVDTLNGHNYVLKAAKVEPTCSVAGHEAIYQCSICQNEIGGDEILATNNHNYNVEVVAYKAPTCIEEGVNAKYKCATCELTIGGSVIEATGIHDYSVLVSDEIAATCIKDGLTEKKQCATCTSTFGGTVIPKSDKYHDFETVVVKPTCTANGYTEKVCKVCDYSEIVKNSQTDKIAHKLVLIDEGKDVTCISSGKNPTYECSVCGYLQGGQTIPRDPNAHKIAIIPAVEPTCSDIGYTEGKKCTVCGRSIEAQTVIPATGHVFDYSTVAIAPVEPTCTEDGKTARYACTKCDGYTEGETIPASGHSLVDHGGQVPTCTEDGWNAYQTCTKCDYSSKVIRPKIAHIYSILLSREVKADCINDGVTAKYQCKSCDLTIGGEVIPASGHSYIDHEAKNPTCLIDGNNAYQTCANCDYNNIVIIPATGLHSYDLVVSARVEPTCTREGKEAVKRCVTCSLTAGGEKIPMCGHTDLNNDSICDVCLFKIPCKHEITELRNAREATCTVKGYSGDVVCVNCNAIVELGSVSPNLKHTEQVIPAVAATCTSTGLTEGIYCTSCNQVVVKQYPTSRLAHTKAVVPGVQATCQNAGRTDEVYCSVCGITIEHSVVIPQLSHTDTNKDGACDNCGIKINTSDCSCNCHKSGFMGFIYKIQRIFWKLFGTNKECKCGVAHY